MSVLMSLDKEYPFMKRSNWKPALLAAFVLLVQVSVAGAVTAPAAPSAKTSKAKKASSTVAQSQSQLTPEQKALHVLNRLAYGPAPGDLDRVMTMGVDAYIREQLLPTSLQDPPELTARLDQFETLKLTPAQLYANIGPPARKIAGKDEATLKVIGKQQARAADEAREARMLRAIYSPAQLRESLVDFWYNHFNVFIGKGQEDTIWVGSYEQQAIRPHALGKFRELLGATAKHPAMLYYLDNWQSSAPRTDKKTGKVSGGLNENFAREVMELHSLGVDGGYTQKDVTELARILTGWTFVPKKFDADPNAAFEFDKNKHDAGEKSFLGKTFPAGGGVEEGEQALDMLAAHPSTAKYISFQLAQYFLNDKPPQKLVDRMALRFRETDGDVAATLEVLFKSADFWSAENVGAKFKTPYQYVVSAVRTAGLPMVTNVKPLLGVLSQNGQPLFGCLTPDGYKNTEEAWLNPDAMLYRLNFANSLGSGLSALWQVQPEPVSLAKVSPPPPEPEVAAADMNASMDMQPNMTPAVMSAADAPKPQSAQPPSPQPQAAQAPKPPQPKPPAPPDPFAMQVALGAGFSLETTKVLAAARPPLRPGLILGSPDFMRR